MSTWKHPQALNATYIFIKRGMFVSFARIARTDFLDKIFIAIFFLPQIDSINIYPLKNTCKRKSD